MHVARDPCSLSASFPALIRAPHPPHAPRLCCDPDQADQPCGEPDQVPSLIVSQGLGEIVLHSLLSLGPRGFPIDNNGTFTLQARALHNKLFIEKMFCCWDRMP